MPLLAPVCEQVHRLDLNDESWPQRLGDAVEDEKQRQGLTDELPKELARRESRLKKIRQARAELEAEARQKAAQAKADAKARMAQRRKQEERTGKKTGGGQPRVPDPKQAAPDAKA